MKLAEYPERTCREPVAGEYLMYNCELAELHPGPCASYSSKASVVAREAWERGETARIAKEAEQSAKAAAKAVARTPRGRRRNSDA